jgi:hypothetical protein
MVTDSYRNKTPVRGLALLASLGAGSLALTGCAAPAAEIEPVAAERLSLDGCNAQAGAEARRGSRQRGGGQGSAAARRALNR